MKNLFAKLALQTDFLLFLGGEGEALSAACGGTSPSGRGKNK
jgi:hypothetical protein